MPASVRGLNFVYRLVGLMLLVAANSAHAQLLAVDDSFGVPFGEPLLVENPGVLKNDTLEDDEGKPQTDFGGTTELLTDVSNGTLSCPSNGALKLCADGSFDYAPGPGFSGTDSFTYQASSPDFSDTATVTLTACSGGPELFTCWKESSFRAKLAELGFSSFAEGFESAAWDGVRSSVNTSNTAPEITSQGISWTTNHPATNPITTGSGPALTGEWGVYDANHGDANGSSAVCDVDEPPVTCLFHDGISGSIPVNGDPLHSSLHAVGAYITGFSGANIDIILDGVNQGPIGKLPDSGHHFFGVIDTSMTGFKTFSFEEQDGKVGQALFIFADDFIIATAATCLAAGYEIPASTWTKFAIPCAVPDNSVGAIFTGANTDSLVLSDYEITWIVYSRNASAEEDVALNIADTLAPGVGYWIYSTTATTVGVSGLAHSFDDIDLIGAPGGRDNNVGHTQAVSVDWNKVQVVDGGTVLNYGQYGDVMSIEMNKWNGAAYQVFNGITPDRLGTLDPFDGFWVNALEPDIKLRIPAGAAEFSADVIAAAPLSVQSLSVQSFTATSTSTSTNTKVEKTKKPKKAKKPKYAPWFIRLTASAGDMEDPGNVFGQLETAYEGNDAHDLEEPAPIGSRYLSILFPNPLFEQPDWGYTTDFRALTKRPRGQWPFVVKAYPGISEVTIRWEGEDYLFKDAWLVDESTGETVRAKAGKSYTFIIEQGERHFSFELGE